MNAGREPPELEQSIPKLAAWCLREQIGYADHFSGRIPRAQAAEISLAVKQLEADLEEDDLRELAGYAQIFSPSPTKHDMAIAALWLRIETAQRQLTSEAFLVGHFADSKLDELVPALAREVDNDGLVPVTLLDPLPDAFRFGDFAVHLSEGIPYGLSRLLTAIARERRDGFRVRLSAYRVEPICDYKETLYEARIRGRTFDETLLTTRLRERKPNFETELQRIAESEVEALVFRTRRPVEKLVVNRKEEKKRVSFLAEELVPLPEVSNRLVETRIYHSDIAWGADCFSHADGTILVYQRDAYERRLASRVADKVDAQCHFKLYWLSNVPLLLWTELFQRTFPGNELVVEYLTGREQRLGNLLV